MTEIFADSFYWLALLNPEDAYHQKVKSLSLPGRLVVTGAIQLEVMDSFSDQRLRPLALAFWQECSANPDLLVVPLDDALLRKGVELFDQRPDKDWSLTDCISFTVMSERGIVDALTGDHHFEQAGFRAVFRD